jgi:hypothetical protein
MSEKVDKKVVRRSVIIALGTICIILIGGLISALVYYTITINDRDQIINLTKSTIWVNNQTITEIPQDSTTNWTFKADYAGYISVQFHNGTTVPSAEVVYSYQGIHYDRQLVGETEAFPVMPSNIEITVGEAPLEIVFKNPSQNFTVSIIYYY